MPPDMLVKLYALNDTDYFEPLPDGVALKRAFIADRDTILHFIRKEFPKEKSWPYECEYALLQNPTGCFLVASEGEIIGFSCFDATARGFFGPMGVRPDFRGRGIGKALLLRTLFAMKELGYAYAVIGWPTKNAVEFYKRVAGAVEIEGADPQNSVYRNMIRFS